jgi:hypothetical protein
MNGEYPAGEAYHIKSSKKTPSHELEQRLQAVDELDRSHSTALAEP